MTQQGRPTGSGRMQVPPEPDWDKLGAACRNNPEVNEDWFHPDKDTEERLGIKVSEQVALAKEVCETCPTRCFNACYEYSFELRATQALGVMAGLTEGERRPLRKKREKKAS